MGGSSSNSSPSTSEATNTQQTTSVTGSTGSSSPTIAAQGNVTFQDSGGPVSIAAVQAVRDVVQNVLAGASQLTQQSVQAATSNAASNSSDQNALLTAVLARDQAFSAAPVTQGGSLSFDSSKITLYVVGGIAALLVLVFAMRSSK